MKKNYLILMDLKENDDYRIGVAEVGFCSKDKEFKADKYKLLTEDSFNVRQINKISYEIPTLSQVEPIKAELMFNFPNFKCLKLEGQADKTIFKFIGADELDKNMFDENEYEILKWFFEKVQDNVHTLVTHNKLLDLNILIEKMEAKNKPKKILFLEYEDGNPDSVMIGMRCDCEVQEGQVIHEYRLMRTDDDEVTFDSWNNVIRISADTQKVIPNKVESEKLYFEGKIIYENDEYIVVKKFSKIYFVDKLVLISVGDALKEKILSVNSDCEEDALWYINDNSGKFAKDLMEGKIDAILYNIKEYVNIRNKKKNTFNPPDLTNLNYLVGEINTCAIDAVLPGKDVSINNIIRDMMVISNRTYSSIMKTLNAMLNSCKENGHCTISYSDIENIRNLVVITDINNRNISSLMRIKNDDSNINKIADLLGGY